MSKSHDDRTEDHGTEQMQLNNYEGKTTGTQTQPGLSKNTNH